MVSDTWIKANSEIQAEVLHALGVVSYRWNSCEFALKLLFSQTFKLGPRDALLITQEMGSVTMSNLIRESSELGSNHPNKIPAILHALNLFEINRLNRNQLTHYLPADSGSGELELRRNKKLGGVTGEVIPSTVKDVRRVADEIKTLRTHLSHLVNHLINYRYSDTYPLPEKPPLPERLWKPPPQDQSKPRSRPVP